MITLYQPKAPGGGWGRNPNMSPFCAKLETYLRMAEIPYIVKSGIPNRGPKGKIPYIKDGDVRMGDSGLIIQYLQEKYGNKLDSHYKAEQLAVGHAVRSMIEGHTYFFALYHRWSNDEAFGHIYALFKQVLPKFFGPIIMNKVRKQTLNTAYVQGASRHSFEESLNLMKKDYESVSQILGKNKYLLGETPSTFDATVFAFVVAQLWVPWKHPMQDYIRSLGNLEPYIERMYKQYWT